MGCDVGEQHQKILDDLQNRYDNNCENTYEDSLNLEWTCKKTYGNKNVEIHVYTAGRDGPDAPIEPSNISYESGDPTSTNLGTAWSESQLGLCTAYADYQDFLWDSVYEANPDCDLFEINKKVITLLDLAIGNCEIVGKEAFNHYICDSEVGYADYMAVNADVGYVAVPYDIHIGATKSSTEYPAEFIQDDLCAAPEIVWGAIQEYLLPEVLDELQPDPADPVLGLPPAWDMNTWYRYDYEAAITQFDDMGNNWYADYKSGVKDYMSGVTDFYGHLFSKSNNDETSAVEDADVVVAPPAAEETDHADSADHVTDAADAAATATDSVNNVVKVTVSSASLLSSSIMGIAAVTTAFVAMV